MYTHICIDFQESFNENIAKSTLLCIRISFLIKYKTLFNNHMIFLLSWINSITIYDIYTLFYILEEEMKIKFEFI